jgi:hypothetical protein
MKIIERHRYKDKEIFQTRRLTFEPFKYTEKNMCLVIGLIRKNLSSDLLKGRKSLMYPDDVNFNPCYGHCYHSSQALVYLMDTDLLYPMSAEDYRGEKHWWVQNGDKIYDCTAEQYFSVGKLPPYEQGKKSRWYGWKERPQQISLELMKKVLGQRLLTDEIINA